MLAAFSAWRNGSRLLRRGRGIPPQAMTVDPTPIRRFNSTQQQETAAA
jgi:hypothetical protein